YSCLLILSAQTARDYAGEVAENNQLAFREVQQWVPHCPTEDLSRLQEAVERDYAVLQALLKQIHGNQSQLEWGMLRVHYRLLGVRFQVSRSFSADAARQVLTEMCGVVGHLANGIGAAAAA